MKCNHGEFVEMLWGDDFNPLEIRCTICGGIWKVASNFEAMFVGMEDWDDFDWEKMQMGVMR